MRSLSVKLGGALLLMVAISVGLTAFFSNFSTAREFNAYLSQNNQRYQQTATTTLAQAYIRDGGWANIQLVLDGLLRSTTERLVVADSSTRIVGDTDSQWLGLSASDVGLSGGTDVIASGQSVGELYTFLTQGTGGRGFMGGGRGGPASTVPSESTSEQQFLNSTNRLVLISGAVSGLIALLIGFFLTRRITGPVKALAQGAKQIAKGNLSHRVKIKAADELEDLGASFNAMASSLEEAEEARRHMVSDIAHELRTPLTIIDGTVDGIQDGVFEPDSDRLGVIKEQTALLARLTSDLRDLSLAESGQLKLELSPTDIVDLVRKRTSQFVPTAEKRGVRLDLELPGEVPRSEVDAARIEQVLGNLLNNAIRHTPSGGRVTVSVSAGQGEMADSERGLVVAVADTGEGISADQLPFIFERFYRVESSRSRNEGGAGLGLAIVKRMIEAHGGRVWAQSEPGKGSTFFFWLKRTRV